MLSIDIRLGDQLYYKGKLPSHHNDAPNTLRKGNGANCVACVRLLFQLRCLG